MTKIDDPRSQLMNVDYSGLHAEPGSRGWILTQRSLLVACLFDIKNNRRVAKTVYDDILEHGGWHHLSDLRGKSFHSFEQFCKSPNGLGLAKQEIERRLTAQDLAADPAVTPAAPHRRPTKAEQENKGANGTFKRGTNNAAYIVRRLKRDRPEIAEALARGEFPSARAAAIAAGFIKPTPTWPERVLNAWEHCTPQEKKKLHTKLMQGLRQ